MAPLKFEFELEFLTPAFLGGADPVKRADFNLQALKRAMRYWWRQTQIWGTSDARGLFAEEKKRFGTTDLPCPFSLQVIDRKCLKYKSDLKGFLHEDEKNATGPSYLFYSCKKRPGGRQEGRQAWIEAGSTVRFAATFFHTALIPEVVYSLWLAQTFGGLGARSRRGAGSFRISLLNGTQKVNDYSIADLFIPENTADELAKTLKDEASPGRPCTWPSWVQKGSPLFNGLTRTKPNHFKKFGSEKDADAVLDQIGNKMREFRSVFGSGGSRFRNDAGKLHKFATSDSSTSYTGRDPLPKHAFGLPIIYNFRRRGGGGLESQYIEATPQNYGDFSCNRRASPLFISVCRDVNLFYYANLLVVWEEFLPRGQQVILTVKDRYETDKGPLKTHTLSPPAHCTEIIKFFETL